MIVRKLEASRGMAPFLRDMRRTKNSVRASRASGRTIPMMLTPVSGPAGWLTCSASVVRRLP